MSVPSDVALLDAVRARAESIVDRWYQAIDLTGVSEANEVEVRTTLRDMLDQIATLLAAAPDDRRARTLGAALVRLRYNTPESLAVTIELLSNELTTGIDTTSVLVLLPRVTRLMAMLAAGFCAEMRAAVLIEQEQIRRALTAARQQQETIIQAQAAVLNELSTPLIPVSDTIVVMPLVGAIDSRRAQQVMETLLEGISERHAQIAILDITGVTVVDTQVANALLHAAQAVSLVGARIILTGIRPEIAQTLVGLGVDLRELVTRSTLQDGISYALRQR